jgi:predicted RNA binding protein with dsRBD fold (UPF0201 family)
MMALAHGASQETVEFLVAKGANITAKDKVSGSRNDALQFAHMLALRMISQFRDGKIISSKRTRFWTPQEGRTALFFALEKQASKETVEFLIAKGADVNMDLVVLSPCSLQIFTC